MTLDEVELEKRRRSQARFLEEEKQRANNEFMAREADGFRHEALYRFSDETAKQQEFFERCRQEYVEYSTRPHPHAHHDTRFIADKIASAMHDEEFVRNQRETR